LRHLDNVMASSGSESSSSQSESEEIYSDFDDLNPEERKNRHGICGGHWAKHIRKNRKIPEEMHLESTSRSLDGGREGGLQAERCLAGLDNQRTSRLFCDVNLVPEDGGAPLLAHRAVLASVSEHFAALLGGSFQEAARSDVRIEVPRDVLEKILDFIYRGEVTLARDKVFSFSRGADFLGLDFVNELVLEWICRWSTSFLTWERLAEAFETWSIWPSKLQSVLAERAAAFGRFRRSPVFMQLSCAGMRAVLSLDELCVRSESEVLRASRKWAHAKGTAEARGVLETHVRWSLLRSRVRTSRWMLKRRKKFKYLRHRGFREKRESEHRLQRNSCKNPEWLPRRIKSLKTWRPRLLRTRDVVGICEEFGVWGERWVSKCKDATRILGLALDDILELPPCKCFCTLGAGFLALGMENEIIIFDGAGADIIKVASLSAPDLVALACSSDPHGRSPTRLFAISISWHVQAWALGEWSNAIWTSHCKTADGETPSVMPTALMFSEQDVWFHGARGKDHHGLMPLFVLSKDDEEGDDENHNEVTTAVSVYLILRTDEAQDGASFFLPVALGFLSHPLHLASVLRLHGDGQHGHGQMIFSSIDGTVCAYPRIDISQERSDVHAMDTRYITGAPCSAVWAVWRAPKYLKLESHAGGLAILLLGKDGCIFRVDHKCQNANPLTKLEGWPRGRGSPVAAAMVQSRYLVVAFRNSVAIFG